MPEGSLNATGGFEGSRGLFGRGCACARSTDGGIPGLTRGPLRGGIGMETSTKLPGDRLRLPEPTVSSVNGVSSIPGKERVIHKKGEWRAGMYLASEDN